MFNQNMGRGLLLIAVALIFLVQAPNYTIGTLSRPGPGLFPVMIASIVLCIGAIIVARSRFMEVTPFQFRIRNIALIASGLIAFALISEYVNMLAGIVVMTAMVSYASEDFSIKRTAVIAVALCAIAVAMRKFLSVQLPLY